MAIISKYTSRKYFITKAIRKISFVILNIIIFYEFRKMKND